MNKNIYTSPKKLISVLIGSIFISELLIMFAFSLLPQIPHNIEALLDATLISTLATPFLYFFVFRPMTKHIAKQKEIEDQLRLSATAFETHDAIMITDAKSKIIRVNRAFELMTGYREAEVIGENPRIFNSGRHDPIFYTQIQVDLDIKGTWNGEIWDKDKYGNIYPKETTITAVKNEQGETIQYVSVFTNITDRKKAEDEIYSLAFNDPLTQLPNRRLLCDRLNVALSSSARTHQYGALLYLDLDNFKILNDTLGHEYGDLMLIEVANRLKFSVREDDTVSRIGGDEFVVLLENISNDANDATQKVAHIAEKIRNILSVPYRLKEHTRHSSPSIGVCLFYDQISSVDDLLRRADIAMYDSKSSGRNKVRFFDPDMQKTMELRASLEDDLRSAITKGQLKLYYQIQLNQQRQPIGAEALVRWIHPTRGMVPPNEFIPVAEDSSLIVEIGNWVLESACAQIALWSKDKKTSKLVIAANISAKQFVQPDFVNTIDTLLKKHKIEPSRLKLELTESVLIEDIKSVVTKMNALRDTLGVGLSLDDFGTGYSSLSYLKQLPLDQVKIDQSFVRDMTTDASDAIMVKNIIDMAHNFGLNVIAEGVETEEQLNLLKKNGCKSYQGYLFSKPIPVEHFEEMLQDIALSIPNNKA